MEILIVGLGNIGHAMISSITNKEVIVDTVTTNGEKVEVIKNNLGGEYSIRNNYTYENLVKYDYDFVILTLPYVQKIRRMNQIKDKISKKSTIVIVPANQGTYYFMPKILQDNNKFILLERVPQIARIETKGELVNILGTREDLRYSTTKGADVKTFIQIYSYLDKMVYLENKDDISFISSNATIHTVRVFNLYKDGLNYDKEIMFYKDWTLEDADLFIKVEDEILEIANKKAKLENREHNVYDMYTHFKIVNKTCEEVMEKISTNKALSSIKFYVKDKEDLLLNRYFIDDIMIGIYFFIEMAKKYEVEVPYMEMIYNWGLKNCDEVKEAKYLSI